MKAGVGEVVAVCIGPGGLPNRPVDVARVTAAGVEGDRHRYHEHGGPNRAVCILFDEDVATLERDGVAPTRVGTFGENLRLRGLDPAALRPGDRLVVGEELELEIHDVREPCKTLHAIDRRFPDLMVGRSGFMCRVARPGTVRAGASVRIVPG